MLAYLKLPPADPFQLAELPYPPPPPPPTHTTHTDVTPIGAVQKYVPADAYACWPTADGNEPVVETQNVVDFNEHNNVIVYPKFAEREPNNVHALLRLINVKAHISVLLAVPAGNEDPDHNIVCDTPAIVTDEIL